jgi:hypothetical protein
MKNTGASDAASRGVPEWLRNGQGRWGLLSQEPKMMVRKYAYIQSTLEEKLSTSDIGVYQWCSAKIVSGPVPHSTTQLSNDSDYLTKSSWVKGGVHMLLSEDQLHCVVIGL